jgi:hypothetical protein
VGAIDDSVSTDTSELQEEEGKKPGIFDKLARVGDVSGYYIDF